MKNIRNTHKKSVVLQLMFEARRIDNLGGSDFAIDDITMPVSGCVGIPLVVYSPNSVARGI